MMRIISEYITNKGNAKGNGGEKVAALLNVLAAH